MRALVLAVLLAAAPAWAGVVKGQKAPDFSLPTLAGDKISLAQLRGKVVVLDFWAQWCEPCKHELPQLEKLARQYAGKAVVFVGVNIDKQRANAERLVRQLGLTFPTALDSSGAVAAKYDLPKMPTSFVIDQKGIVRFVHEGYEGQSDVARFQRELDELLK